MGLKIRLKPNERVIINGVVLQNAARNCELIVHNRANILRAPDVMQEEEADTPAKRVYFAAQLMLIDPERAETYKPVFADLAAQLSAALVNPAPKDRLAEAVAAVGAEDIYRALRCVKDVIAYERGLLAPTAAQPS